MRLNGTQRLFVVIPAVAVALWFLVPLYRDALDQIGEQLRNNSSGHAQAADDRPRHYRRRQCTGSIWSNDPLCGPWQEEGR
jgi:hypothetical protein